MRKLESQTKNKKTNTKNYRVKRGLEKKEEIKSEIRREKDD